MAHYLELYAQTSEELVTACDYLAEKFSDAFATYDVQPEAASFPEGTPESEDYRFRLQLALTNSTGGVRRDQAIKQLIKIGSSLRECSTLSNALGFAPEDSGTSGRSRRDQTIFFIEPLQHTLTLWAATKEEVTFVCLTLKQNFPREMRNYERALIMPCSADAPAKSGFELTLNFFRSGKAACSHASSQSVEMFHYLRAVITTPGRKFDIEEREAGRMERDHLCAKKLLIEILGPRA